MNSDKSRLRERDVRFPQTYIIEVKGYAAALTI
jgi:hypothetical protein